MEKPGIPAAEKIPTREFFDELQERAVELFKTPEVRTALLFEEGVIKARVENKTTASAADVDAVMNHPTVKMYKAINGMLKKRDFVESGSLGENE
jgi:hypothetical protein